MTDYFLIQRNYRSLGKVAWLIIAAAKASGPPPLSMNGVYRNQGTFFFLFAALFTRIQTMNMKESQAK